MDETLFESALSGSLEQEGGDNVFMSELGWAVYLDKYAESSYNMNERFSEGGYITPDLFDSPIKILEAYKNTLVTTFKDPLNACFMTISNDPQQKRSFPKGATEVDARTIKPKTKDFNPKLRIVGITGFNLFGVR